ncbi:IclR family transcriptional regulator [Pseudonocardiaceae bacterium YIM PH 21723]|nr:IclR family transcriptional regulator [Pseudonocardiaceae bacterium YIM PH 21723]
MAHSADTTQPGHGSLSHIGSQRTSEENSEPPAQRAASGRTGEIAQTLDRGLVLLQLLATEPAGLSPTESAQRLGVHRTIAARLLTTLVHRGFVSRRRDGRYVVGPTVVNLSHHVFNAVAGTAAPLLRESADRLGVTTVLMTSDGDHAVVLACVEPNRAPAALGIPRGTRYPLRSCAGGLAILAARNQTSLGGNDLTMVVRAARARGYVLGAGDPANTTTSVASPLGAQAGVEASVALTVRTDRAMPEHPLGSHVIDLANRITRALS